MAVSFTTNTSLYCTGYTVSAGIISVGSTSSVAAGNIASFIVRPMGAQLAVMYQATSAFLVKVTLFSTSVVGVITASTLSAVVTSASTLSLTIDVLVSGNKLIIASYDSVNIVTNTSGTASAGTMITIYPTYTVSRYWTAISASNNLALFVGAISPSLTLNTRATTLVIDYSGASPSVSRVEDVLFTAGTLSGFYAPLTYYGDRTGAWFYGDLNFNAQFPTVGAKWGVYSKGALYAYSPKNMCVFGATNLNITGSFTAGPTISGANNEIWNYSSPYLTRYESIT